MRYHSALLFLAPFLRHALAASRTSPPAGCLTVGSSGTYSTISDAVGALSTASTADQCIFIYPGTYAEQVLVPATSSPITIYGSTADTSSYAANTVTITAGHSQMENITNDQTATLRVKTDGFKLYNVNVANTYGEGSQAVALSAMSDSGFYGCQLTGFQDTLYAMVGTQVYAQNLIVGATDFIFGMNASVWFEQNDIHVLEAELGWVTANGRSTDDNDSFYVFNACSVAAADGNDVPDGAYYLGRPWRDHARVVFQESELSAVINPAGWSIWTDDEPNTSNVLFGEFDNTGDGASGVRALFSTALSAPVEIGAILGSDYASAAWFDAEYL